MTTDFPSCYSESHPVARKEHKCCECRGRIERGEKYRVFSGVWDGEAKTYKFCEDCEQLRADVDKGIRDPEELTYCGGLFESVCESGNPEFRSRYVAIMRKRSAKIHHSWIREQHTFPITLPLT